MTTITEQLREAAKQILHPENYPYSLPCTVDELVQAMAAQDLVDRSTMDNLRCLNHSWQTELRLAADALKRISFLLHQTKMPMGTPEADAFGCANEALSRIDQFSTEASQAV